MKPLIFLMLVPLAYSLQSPMEASSMVDQNQVRETENMDPGLIQTMGQQLQFAIGQQLSRYKQDFDARFAELEATCSQGNAVQTDVKVLTEGENQIVMDLVEKFSDQMLRFAINTAETIGERMGEELNRTMADIDLKLQPVQEDIETMRNQISKLVTQDEVADLQQKLTALGTEAATQIQEEVNRLPTRDDLQAIQDQLENQLTVVGSSLRNHSSCGSQDKVQEVLEKLTESDRDLEEISNYMRDAEHSSQCESTFTNIVEHLDTLTEAMAGNGKSLSQIEGTVKQMQEDFVTQLEEFENVVNTIDEGTTNPSSSQPSESYLGIAAVKTSTPPSPEVCRDSNFIGQGRALDVCDAAVRFRKCHLEFVAFHCCRSCLDAGLLRSLPNYRASRNVPVLQALQAIRPNK